jgi:hypothetical protein
MRFTKLVAATAALSLAGTPALAQSAAPLSVVGSMQPAGADLAQSNDLSGRGFGQYGFAIAFFAVAIGLVFLMRDNDDEQSTSP